MSDQVIDTPNVSDKHEELFTRIALDNKLLTKFQLKKASDEQEKRAKEEGKRPPIGDILKALGFLTDRQFQSIENAQRYREQRDYDKRVGRQILRMQLLDQAKVEEALEVQKTTYSKTGTVRTLAEVLEEKKLLSPAQAEEVKHQIETRDKKKSSIGSSAAQKPLPKRDDDDDSMKLSDLDATPATVPVKNAEEDEDEEDEDDEEEDDEEGEEEDDEEEEEEEDEDEEEDEEEEEDEDDNEEDDLADDIEDLPDGSDVELDKDDLEAIEELESAETETDEKGWAADAFDDRPLQKRAGESNEQPITRAPKDKTADKSPAEKLAAVRGEKPATPSPALAKPAPPAPPKPAGKVSERVPAPPPTPRPVSQRAKAPELEPLPNVASAAKAPAAPKGPAKDALTIPGGEVLNDSSISNVDAVPVVAAPKPVEIPGGSVLKEVPSQSAVASTSETASVEEVKKETAKAPSRVDRLTESAEALESLLDKAEAPPPPRPASRRAPRVSDEGPVTRTKTGSSEKARSTTTDDEFAELKDLMVEASPAPAPPKKALPDEATLRRAFDKAFAEAKESLWKRFLEELGRQG
jgi:hypothetical protein